jgi:alkaline phosphatase D
MKTRTAAAILIAQIMTIGWASSQVLSHGPVVGGVTASEAKVFVRTDQAASVALRYGTDPTMGVFSVSQTFTTDSASDFTRIIPLAGLGAETTYYLDVLVNGVPELAAPYPSFTTFPPSGSFRDFSFIVLSDFTTIASLKKGTQTFASAAAANPVFAFIGGDFDHRNPKTLDKKRKMFKDLYDPNTLYMDGFVPLILRKMAIIHQWDDHDSGLNNCDKNYANWALSQQAFQEYMPTYPLPSVTPGIWQQFSYAQVDCFVLDCRSQRDPENDPDDPNKSMLDGNALGATGELAWLKAGLLASSARWKIVFSSVVTNTGTKFPDGWAGYQTEWNGLRDFITTNNIKGVVFISGDLHLGAIDDGTNAGFPEMCVAQPTGNETGHCPTSSYYGTWSEGYYAGTCTGFGLVTVSQSLNSLTFKVADQYGNIHISYTVPGPPG